MKHTSKEILKHICMLALFAVLVFSGYVTVSVRCHNSMYSDKISAADVLFTA